jgi:dienelactone hydrolase
MRSPAMHASLRWLFAVSALTVPPLAGQTSTTRAEFLRLLDRLRVPLAPSTTSQRAVDGYSEELVSFAAEANERVPTLILKTGRDAGRRPVVIVLHGTGGSKEGMRSQLLPFADKGFLAVAIDARFHGERAVGASDGLNAYESAMVRAYRTGRGHPYLYDEVWDVMRLIDYLETRPDVDPSRIGVIGNSKGGTEAYLAAAADERIAVVVPLIGVQSYGWSLRNSAAWEARTWTFRGAVTLAASDSNEPVTAAFMRKFYNRITPGLIDRFDGPAMLPLIAPRPLLVINGDSDPRSPLGGIKESAAAAEAAYAKANSPDRFEFHLEVDVAHEVTPQERDAAIAWFVRWLRPTTD